MYMFTLYKITFRANKKSYSEQYEHTPGGGGYSTNCEKLPHCEKLQNYRAKKEQILSEVCMIKKGLIVLFTGDVLRKSMFKRLVYTLPDSSPRFTCKLNLSNTKVRPDFLLWPPFQTEECNVSIGCPQGLSWLLCFLKLYFGVVQLHSLSNGAMQERLVNVTL